MRPTASVSVRARSGSSWCHRRNGPGGQRSSLSAWRPGAQCAAPATARICTSKAKCASLRTRSSSSSVPISAISRIRRGTVVVGIALCVHRSRGSSGARSSCTRRARVGAAPRHRRDVDRIVPVVGQEATARRERPVAEVGVTRAGQNRRHEARFLGIRRVAEARIRLGSSGYREVGPLLARPSRPLWSRRGPSAAAGSPGHAAVPPMRRARTCPILCVHCPL